ncbi:MAG: MvaI/BcnI family restriction endonuclease [Candidatus Symbiobacter sp.]|nr:MvaI/BcnI family restriction endonuclease [Candidatus Symbiobacter sp.]
MQIYTKESIISALRDIRDQGWIESRRHNNHGGVGNTLEDLLGIEENNLPIPNAAEWELKVQRSDTNSLITLFHMEPSPTAYKFVPQILLPLYGWPHQKAGKSHPIDEKSFRQTINAATYSDRGFTVLIDKKNRKIVIGFDGLKISEHHKIWQNSVMDRVGLGQLSPQPYWGFDDVFHKLGSKLHNCFYVRAQRKRENGKEYFLYSEIMMLRELAQEKFISTLESGQIYVDFDARTGHNHGTKFRISQLAIPGLYKEVMRI